MNTRALLASFAVLMMSAPLAHAQSAEAQVREQLLKQGYTNLSVSRTFLGRVRIKTQRGNLSREIVLNPRTGEILRDLVVLEDKNGDHTKVAIADPTEDEETDGSSSGAIGETGGGHESATAGGDTSSESGHSSDGDGSSDGGHSSDGGEGGSGGDSPSDD